MPNATLEPLTVLAVFPPRVRTARCLVIGPLLCVTPKPEPLVSEANVTSATLSFDLPAALA